MQLPLFPLDLFLLPGESITLHIFEPRYKQLVKDVIASVKRQFAIPFFSIINTSNYASVVRIISAYNYNQLGECDIDVICENVGIVQQFKHAEDSSLYASGKVLLSSVDWDAPMSKDFLGEGINRILSGVEVFIDKRSLLYFFRSMNPNVMDKLAYVSKLNHDDKEHYVLQYAKYFQNISEQESKVFESIYLN
jgi:hypothetical protein